MEYKEIPRDYDSNLIDHLVEQISKVDHPELLLEDVALKLICKCTKGYAMNSNYDALDELYQFSEAEDSLQLQNFESRS